MTSYSISTHAGTTQTLTDHSLAIMDACFAPFDEATFPRQLSVPQLSKLLESHFAMHVPLAPSTFQSVDQLRPDHLFKRLLLQPLCWLQYWLIRCRHLGQQVLVQSSSIPHSGRQLAMVYLTTSVVSFA